MITASGVAPDTPSNVKLVIGPVNARSRKHRAPSAGFIKFCPSPPKIIFTTTMANAPPMIGMKNGTVWDRFRPRSKPVTTQLKSPMVCF